MKKHVLTLLVSCFVFALQAQNKNELIDFLIVKNDSLLQVTDNQDRVIEERNLIINELTRSNTRFKSRGDSLSTVLVNQTVQIAQQEKRIDDLNRQANRLKGRSDSLNTVINRHLATINTQTTTIAERDRSIREYSTLSNTLKSGRDSLARLQAEQTEALRRQSQTLTERNATIAELNSLNSKLRKRGDSLDVAIRQQLESHNVLLTQLNSAHRTQLQGRTDSLSAVISWQRNSYQQSLAKQADSLNALISGQYQDLTNINKQQADSLSAIIVWQKENFENRSAQMQASHKALMAQQGDSLNSIITQQTNTYQLRLASQLDSLNQVIAQQNKDFNTIIARQQDTITSQLNAIRLREKTIENYISQTQRLDAKTDSMQVIIDRQLSELQRQAVNLESNKEEMAAKDAMVLGAKAENDVLQSVIADLRKEVDAKLATIAELNQNIAELTREKEAQQNETNSIIQSRDSLAQRIAPMQTQIDDLYVEIQEALSKTEDLPNVRKLTGVFSGVGKTDCFHLFFRDETGRTWNFGAAANAFPFPIYEYSREGDRYSLLNDFVGRKLTIIVADLYGQKCENGIISTRYERIPTIIDILL